MANTSPLHGGVAVRVRYGPLNDSFQGYSLYCKIRISDLRYDRNRKTSPYRILIAQDVEYLRCMLKS